MRRLIEEAYADHGIIGEELAPKPAQGRYSWSLDPIDGTRSFACGLPTWVTLIALIEDGAPLIGIIDAPRLDERYVGAGGRAWLNAGGMTRPLRTSDCAVLAMARLSTTDPYLFDGDAAECFEALRSKVRTTRYGHDGYAYARLAAGTLDLVVESGLQPHDYNALMPVIRGAGGAFGDWCGGSDFKLGAVIAAATPQLYEDAVEIMSDAVP